MREWLINHGIQSTIILSQIWDFLSISRKKGKSAMCTHPLSLVYAGALNRRKNSFLYQFNPHNQGIYIALYGAGFDIDTIQCKSLIYKGFCDHETFINQVRGDYGLVWDGDSLTECCGSFGSYLRYNTPHKLSLYIRSHLPIIIWSEAAMAPFVQQWKIGVTVDSLYNLSKKPLR